MRRAVILAGVLWVASSAALAAHRVDEYLQATRIALSADAVHVEIDLTPGADVADRVTRLMDRDGDGDVSAVECRQYASVVVSAATLELDGRPLRLDVSRYDCPSVDEFRDGVGTVRLRADASASPASPGEHRLRFSNRHAPEMSVYLVNAMLPPDGPDGIDITGQQRDPWQRQFTLEFSGHRAPRPASSAWPLFVSGLGVLAVLIQFRIRRGAATRP